MRDAFLSLLVLIFTATKAHCGIPFSKTFPIEGTIVDSQTRQPIQGVIVIVQCFKAKLIGDGPSATEIPDQVYVLSGEDGKYRVPSQQYWTPFGFHGCKITVDHWLYELSGAGAIYANEFRTFVKKSSENGILHVNFELKDLDTKYRSGDIRPTEGLSFRHGYFALAKRLGITANPNDALKKWQEWASRYPTHSWNHGYAVLQLKKVLQEREQNR